MTYDSQGKISDHQRYFQPRTKKKFALPSSIKAVVAPRIGKIIHHFEKGENLLQNSILKLIVKNR